MGTADVDREEWDLARMTRRGIARSDTDTGGLGDQTAWGPGGAGGKLHIERVQGGKPFGVRAHAVAPVGLVRSDLTFLPHVVEIPAG